MILFAWINYRRERLNQKIAYINLRQQYFTALRLWADSVVDLLTAAVILSELDPVRCLNPTFFEIRNNSRMAVSAAIDKGRWFFTNVRSRHAGNGPHGAFEGYRKGVLNSLVDAYDKITELDYVNGEGNRTRRQDIVDAKIAFVNEIQLVLDPAARDLEFQNITKQVTGKV